MHPWWKSADPKTRVRLYLGDVLSVLKRLRTGSVQMSICSPPYWNLRDYGTGTWVGGDPKCSHKRDSQKRTKNVAGDGRLRTANTNWNHVNETAYKDGVCRKCGAKRIDHQLGSEKIPDCKQRHGNCAEKDWENGCFVCADETTEILTNEGWKTYEEVVVGDVCAQYDETNNTVSWGKIKNLHVYDVTNEKLVSAESGRMSMLLTKNHRCLLWSYKTGRTRFVEAGDLKLRNDIPIVRPWKDEAGETPCSEEFAELLGWYLTEGNRCWTHHNEPKLHSNRLEITQSASANPEKCRRIEYILEKTGADWSGRKNKYRRNRWMPANRERMTYTIRGDIAEKLIAFSPDKKLQPSTVSWSLPLIRALIRGLVGGDGNVSAPDTSSPGRITFTQKDEYTTSIVQSLFFRLGVSSVVIPVVSREQSHYVAYTQNSTNRRLKSLSTVRYSGVVWCPETDFGTWVARRNGHIFITGNCRMVLVFREIRRVLRDDGVCLINIGDSYSSGSGGSGTRSSKQKSNKGTMIAARSGYKGLASGNLVGVPWRLALALQADGWVLRSDIPWLKAGTMPESGDKRPSKSLEYVFMFTKSMDYFWDMEAVRRTIKQSSIDRITQNNGNPTYSGASKRRSECHIKGADTLNPSQLVDRAGRFFRNYDLWYESVEKPYGLVGIEDELIGIDVTSEGISADHYASYPQALVRPFIKACTSQKGCCAKCGRCWVRIVEKDRKATRPAKEGKMIGKDADLETGNRDPHRHVTESRTVGWRPDCECHGKLIKKKIKYMGYGSYHDHKDDETGYGMWRGGKQGPGRPGRPGDKEFEKWITEYESDLPLDEHPVKSCMVLDPFIGSGTTSLVAQTLGRRSIGIDLSEKYLKMAKKRIESRGIIGKTRKPEPDDLFIFGDD